MCFAPRGADGWHSLAKRKVQEKKETRLALHGFRSPEAAVQLAVLHALCPLSTHRFLVEMGSMGLRCIKPFNSHSTLMEFYDYLHFTYENMETQTS